MPANPENREVVQNQQNDGPVKIEGLKYQSVPGDGHCLFHAVGLYLGKDQGSLRQSVATYIAQNKSKLEESISALLAEGRTIDDYLKALRNGQEWADHIEIGVLMRIYNRPIVIIGPNGEIRNRVDIEEREGEPIFVYYNGHNHYDGYVLREDYHGRGGEILRSLTQLSEHSPQQRQQPQAPKQKTEAENTKRKTEAENTKRKTEAENTKQKEPTAFEIRAKKRFQKRHGKGFQPGDHGAMINPIPGKVSKGWAKIRSFKRKKLAIKPRKFGWRRMKINDLGDHEEYELRYERWKNLPLKPLGLLRGIANTFIRFYDKFIPGHIPIDFQFGELNAPVKVVFNQEEDKLIAKFQLPKNPTIKDLHYLADVYAEKVFDTGSTPIIPYREIKGCEPKLAREFYKRLLQNGILITGVFPRDYSEHERLRKSLVKEINKIDSTPELDITGPRNPEEDDQPNQQVPDGVEPVHLV